MNEPLLCGDTQIRFILSVDETFDVERAKNIQFQDAFERANQYIQKQRNEELDASQQLADLETQWYQSMAATTSGRKGLQDSVVGEAITKSVVTAFSSLEVAQENDCSMLAESAPGGQDPYVAAESNFQAAFLQLLQNGTFGVTSTANVKRICLAAIQARSDSSMCHMLCDSLAAKAMSLSERPLATSAGQPSSAEISRQIEQIRRHLEELRSDIKDCETTRDGIQRYEKKIKEIGSEHDLHGKLSRQVQSRLKAVQSCLDRVDQCNQGQQRLLTEFQKLMGKTKGQEKTITTQLLSNRKHQEELRQQIEQVKVGLTSLQAVLKESQKAIGAMQAFKARVVVAMQSFVQIYNDAVRAPLKALGLLKVLENLNDNVWPTLSEEKKWSGPARYIEDLESECQAVAQSATNICPSPAASAAGGAYTPTPTQDPNFSEKSEVDAMCKQGLTLKTMCKTEKSAVYVADVRRLVQERQASVKSWLQKLRRELDELADSGVDAAHEKGNIENGEPEYLRRFMSILNSTRFYKDFVQDWSIESADKKGGTMFEMTEAVEAVVAQLTAKAQGATERFRHLNSQWANSVLQDSELHSKLTSISKVLSAEDKMKSTVETKIKEFTSSMASKQNELDHFTKQLAGLKATLSELQGQLQFEFQKFQKEANSSFKDKVSAFLEVQESESDDFDSFHAQPMRPGLRRYRIASHFEH